MQVLVGDDNVLEQLAQQDEEEVINRPIQFRDSF
jgi:hypothetical protein